MSKEWTTGDHVVKAYADNPILRDGDLAQMIDEAIAQARAAAIEECAKVADAWEKAPGMIETPVAMAQAIGACIRKR